MHRDVRYICKKMKNRCARVAGTGRRWVANGVEVGGWSAIGRCRPGESVGPFRLDTNTGCMDLGLGQLIGVLHF